MKRLERALEVAMKRLNEDLRIFTDNDLLCSVKFSKKALAEIDAILHPVEVIEEEVVRWYCPLCNDTYGEVGTNRCCDRDADLVKLTGTIRREKKVVARSAVATGVKLDRGDNGLSIWPHGNSIKGDVTDWGDLYSKTVNVTFEWTE